MEISWSDNESVGTPVSRGAWKQENMSISSPGTPQSGLDVEHPFLQNIAQSEVPIWYEGRTDLYESPQQSEYPYVAEQQQFADEQSVGEVQQQEYQEESHQPQYEEESQQQEYEEESQKQEYEEEPQQQVAKKQSSRAKPAAAAKKNPPAKKSTKTTESKKGSQPRGHPVPPGKHGHLQMPKLEDEMDQLVMDKLKVQHPYDGVVKTGDELQTILAARFESGYQQNLLESGEYIVLPGPFYMKDKDGNIVEVKGNKDLVDQDSNGSGA